MALDFQQIRQQVNQLGKDAPMRARRLSELREQSATLLNEYACQPEYLRKRVHTVVQNHDPNLRCALPAQILPTAEPLNEHFPLTPLPISGTILAADGSQIAPDRHAQLNYCLINVGAILMQIGSPEAPHVSIRSQLYYDEQLYTRDGILTDASVALMRDLQERERLAEMAAGAIPPVISFTDGPIELWGSLESQSSSEFQRRLQAYLETLARLHQLGVITAGYVDKPAANLVMRLLEIASLPESQVSEVKSSFPLRGATDFELFGRLIAPGERSAVFEIQSRSSPNYRDAIALHFFYLNVGYPRRPWLARIEIPGWVAESQPMLNTLHAVLVNQCRVMGNQPYPYLLHRAHEAALVSWQEKEQVTQMIAQELHLQGLEVGEVSHKQFFKNLPGRSAYKR